MINIDAWVMQNKTLDERICDTCALFIEDSDVSAGGECYKDVIWPMCKTDIPISKHRKSSCSEWEKYEMKIELQRFAYSPFGTFGRLTVGGFSCYTVERPWLLNAPNISCIPEGEFGLILDRYHRGGYDAYEIQYVLGRSQILIHIGNSICDVNGCIAVGIALSGWGVKDEKFMWTVSNSRDAFEAFMDAMYSHSKMPDFDGFRINIFFRAMG